MSRNRPTEDVELGKAMCDRLGLNHSMVMRDWAATSTGDGSVMVKLSVIKIMPLEEFEELRQVAWRRKRAGGVGHGPE